MEEVSKARFKELYFWYGREKDGWGRTYWDEFFETDKIPPMKYRVEEPPSPAHDRMMIVTDFAVREHRLFFMTEEAEETHFGR